MLCSHTDSFTSCLSETQEVHILHEFGADFYDHEIRVVVLGYVRPEYNYESMGKYTLCCAMPMALLNVLHDR